MPTAHVLERDASGKATYAYGQRVAPGIWGPSGVGQERAWSIPHGRLYLGKRGQYMPAAAHSMEAQLTK